MEEDYNITGDYSINNINLEESIFNKQEYEYDIANRDALIDNLINWIAETKGSDRYLMKVDLAYLLQIKDEYIFSSISTNKYIAKNDNLIAFNKICIELLRYNKEVE